MPEISITQIAAHTGTSERTIRRWIKQGKLQARPARRRGHYHVDPADLERLTREDMDEITALRAEVATLSQRVDELERLVQTRPAPRQRAASTDQPDISELEPGLVVAADFAQIHGINAGTAKSAFQQGRVPTRRGKWRVPGRPPIGVALDAEGRAKFYQQFYGKGGWQDCTECPHDKDRREAP